MHLLKGVFDCLHAEIALIRNDTYNKSSDMKSDKPIKKLTKTIRQPKVTTVVQQGVPYLNYRLEKYSGKKTNKLERTKS